MELAEKKRLLYVAMTRARDYLAFFMDDDRRKEESFARWLKPLLKLDGWQEPENAEVRTLLNEEARGQSYYLEEVEADGLHAIDGGPPTEPRSVLGNDSLVQSCTLTVKDSNASFSLYQYGADNLPIFKNHPLGTQFNFAAPDVNLDDSLTASGQFNSLDFSTEEPLEAGRYPNISSNNSCQTDLLEAILAETIEPSPVRDGWSRVTPKSSDVEVDARTLGTFFHALMEILPERRTMPDEKELLVIANLQGEIGAHPKKAERLLQEAKPLLVKFFNSDLHKMMLFAKQIFHELPYYKVSHLASTVNRPDLVIETAESKWLIIDYKTDRFPADTVIAQARTHAKQLERYRKDLLEIAGIQANNAIYFAQHGTLYYLEHSEKILKI
jgi:hypothetical protein